MPAERIVQRINQLNSSQERTELLALFNSLIDGIRAVTTKLDGDATVTLTDYTAAFDAVIVK